MRNSNMPDQTDEWEAVTKCLHVYQWVQSKPAQLATDIRQVMHERSLAIININPKLSEVMRDQALMVSLAAAGQEHAFPTLGRFAI